MTRYVQGNGISNRKEAHIDICCNRTEEIVMNCSPGFEDIKLIHRALPEIDFADLSLETTFLGRKFNYPLFISSITGGMDKGIQINTLLAQVAEEFGIGLGVGSQRAAIEDKHRRASFNVIRQYAPNIFLAANIGAVQLNNGFSLPELQEAIKMIQADALILHLNPLQEVIQPEGDSNFRGLLEKISAVTAELKVPVIIKEVGAGISFEVAQELIGCKVAAIEVAGAGGTSWAQIEAIRAMDHNDTIKAKAGMTFKNWGIPTVISTIETLKAAKGRCEVISSGGIRTGMDAAKVLALGAKLVGIALPIACLAANNAKKELARWFNQFIYELKVTMFILGAKNLKALQATPRIITGKTKEWLQARGMD